VGDGVLECDEVLVDVMAMLEDVDTPDVDMTDVAPMDS
jgi:hypothetical protein